MFSALYCAWILWNLFTKFLKSWLTKSAQLKSKYGTYVVLTYQRIKYWHFEKAKLVTGSRVHIASTTRCGKRISRSHVSHRIREGRWDKSDRCQSSFPGHRPLQVLTCYSFTFSSLAPGRRSTTSPDVPLNSSSSLLRRFYLFLYSQLALRRI